MLSYIQHAFYLKCDYFFHVRKLNYKFSLNFSFEKGVLGVLVVRKLGTLSEAVTTVWVLALQMAKLMACPNITLAAELDLKP